MSDSARILLASCLNGSADWLRAATKRGLRVDDFAIATHQEIWKAILALQAAGRGVRLGSVETELRGHPEAAREAALIADTGPSFQCPEFHAETILVERLISDARATLVDGSGSFVGVENIQSFQSRVRALATKLDALANTTHASTLDNNFLPVLGRTIHEMEKQLEAQKAGRAPWITTGLDSLNHVLGGGWQNPGSYVVVGMSGRGKTHLGVHFALEAARAGSAVVYFTVEMPQSQIMRRMMANASQIPSSALAAVDFSDEELLRLNNIPSTHGGIRLAIEDNFGASLERVVDLIRKYRRTGQLDVAVVDYIQQLVPPRRGHTKQQDMLHVAHELKQVCIQEGIVMIILAQANRDAEVAEQAGQKLNATHIEHSHAIYQNADMVAFYQSVERKEKEFSGNKIERIVRDEIIYVDKNRHGQDKIFVPVRLDYEHSRLRGL